MSRSPKTSLVERLVRDRLRSGDLEASAVRLLRLGEDPDDTAVQPPPDNPAAHDGDVLGPRDGAYSNGALPSDGVPLAEVPQGGVKRNGVPFAATPPVTLPPSNLPPMGLATHGHPPGGLASPPVPSPVISEVLIVGPPPDAATRAPPRPEAGFSTAEMAPLALTDRPLASPEDTKTSTGSMSGSLRSAPDLQAAAESHRSPLPAPPPGSRIGTQPDADRPGPVQIPPIIDAAALERGGMVDWSRTRSRISEEFRLVQRQILRAAFGPGAEPGFSNLLMVTSARPGEGKSFTSINLAGSIARQGDHHVLLIDADSKRDSFCYPLGLAEKRGLLDLVANPKLDPAPLIVKTPIERLSILPVGRERDRSAELFSTKEMIRLIQSLGRRYADRLLVLDAPPCLSTSDPAVLAPVVGQILFVVEADRTQRDEVEASLDLIQACPNIAMVLNKQQISSRFTFGAYSSYYSP